MANDVRVACEDGILNTVDEDFRFSGDDGRVRLGKALDHAACGRCETRVGKLSLRLLGPPEVRHGGRPVRFRARKALALLSYLVAERGTRRRGEIIELLWPGSDEAHGRAALRSALSGLRKSLEEAAEPSEKPHLFTEGDSVGLAFGPDLDLDLHALAAAHTLARTNPRADHLDGGARLEVFAGLRAAAEAYRGEFLEGFSLDDAPDFDVWVDAERETWRSRMNLVCERHSRLELEIGNIREAIATASRWTEHAPLSEEAHRRLMEAQIASGDRSGALNTYETFCSVLARTLGTRLGPEMEALAAVARSGAPRPIEPLGLRLEPGLPQPAPSHPGTPFVGRAVEFGTLVEGYRAALSGEAGCVALLGDAGFGKTRLADEFLIWSREQGADVLSGRTSEGGGRLPYGLLIGAIRPRVERERAPDDLLEDVWLSELSRILPELKERYPDLPAPTGNEAEARTRLFEAASRLVMAFAARSPVILFLDDLHWASRASLDMVQYAGRRWAEEGARVLLVLGLRMETTESLPAPFRWVAELDRALQVKRLALGPLAARETLDMFRALAEGGRGRSEAASPDVERFGRWLFEETGGHPLFLAETIKTLLDRGVLAPRLGADGAWAVGLAPGARDTEELRGLVPESVREAIGAQLSRLSPPASELLAAGAVLGSGFTFEELLGVVSLPEDEALSALDEVLVGRLLREADAQSDVYAFTHEKVRDVAYTEAGAARRRVFHRRALAALEEEGTPAARLARHALAAKMPEAAFRHLLAAGDAAMAVLAAEDAIASYQRARDLLNGSDAPRDRRGPSLRSGFEHLYVNLGRAHELAGEWEQAETVYEEMLARAQGVRDPRLECAALNHLAVLAAQRRSDMGRAEVLLRRSLEAAEASGERTTLAETKWNLAQMAAMKGEPESALSHGGRALDLAREAGLEELEARSLFVLGQAYRFAGRWEECVAHASRAAALYGTLDDEPARAGPLATQFIWVGSPPSKELASRAMESLCSTLLAIGETNRGSPAAAVAAARHALSIGRETGNEWAQVNAMVLLGYGLWETGEYAEALRLARSGLERARTVQHPGAILMLAVLASALRTTLGLADTDAALPEVLAATDSRLPPVWRTAALSKLCADRALAGDQEAARRYALEASAIRAAAPTRLIFFDFERRCETQVLLRSGEEGLAHEDARRLGEGVGRNRRFRLVHLRMLAVLNRWDGDPGAALSHLREAEDLARGMGLPGELWQVRAASGELHEECGDDARARDAFYRAARTLRSLADWIDAPALRESFLATPRVRRVLER
jgi:DNA-binding SARP family transcriptional activator/tetratricopeptide (TPR) repeat protein